MPTMRRKLFVALVIVAVLAVAGIVGVSVWGLLTGRVAPGPL